MSKLSFRARALDASKPMPIYLAEELPDLPDYSAINRAVPQMPSGMEKEEECEHHLQRAICAGLIIPTPEVMEIPDYTFYDRLYPPDYKMPKQLIHMQPLGLEQDLPDYDMDSEDERWLKKQQSAAGSRKCDLTELKFEETMERLERSSGQTVVTLREAKALAGKNGPAEHLLAAVYDYWLNKRLAVQQPLLLSVRTEAKPGTPSPYLAFRRRTEKMQTRKNRKNDESSYEKMVKLRRGLSQAVALLDMMRQREKMKKECLKLTIVVLEKRYQARDFSGHMVAEVAAQRVPVPVPILAPPYTAPMIHRPPVDPLARQREKRQYKRRKHLHHSSSAQPHGVSGSSSSSEGETAETVPPLDSSGPFAFRRKPGCHYHMPTASFAPSEEEPWRIGSAKENTFPHYNHKSRYSLTSVRHPSSRFIGFARRRLGRGGRVILDRLCTLDKLWESMDYTIIDSYAAKNNIEKVCDDNWLDAKERENKLASDIKKTEVCSDVTNNSNSGGATQWCYNDVKIKSEPEDIDSTLPQQHEQMDGIIKMEVDQLENIEYNETMNNCVTGCVSVISDNSCSTIDNTSTRKGASTFGPNGAEYKRITEMLVQRGLKRHRTKDIYKSAEEVDDIFGDCIHFRPSSPDSDAVSRVLENSSEDVQVQLTDAQISVQVLPPLCDVSGESLFPDTSLYSTSEFTLGALYGDSLLPECGVLDPKTQWSHTNGPQKLEPDSASETNNKTNIKQMLSENSTWNHSNMLTPSDGTPNSLLSGDDSNHAISTTNGVEWTNDSNLSEKVIKAEKVIPEDIKLSDKRLSSSVFTVRSLDNEKQMFLASDKNYCPISPPQGAPAPQQGIYIPIPTGQVIKKKSEGQGMAVVQMRTPPTVRQVIGRPPLLVAHKVVQGQKVVQQNQKVVQPVQKMIHSGNNTVTKLVQQQIARKLQPGDTAWRYSDDQIIVSSGSGALQPTQQMVTVAVTESLKLRLQGHLLTSTPRDGTVQQAGRRPAVVHLSPSGGASTQPVGGSQVKVVRTLTTAQRNRLLQANFRDLGVLQLQLQTRPNTSFNSESVEGRNANDSTPVSSSVTAGQGNASISSSSTGGASVVTVNSAPPSSTSSTATPPTQQRKSPMEVT